MTKRTSAPKKKAEPIPREPETTIGKGVETVFVKDTTPRCSECTMRVWRGELCYSHHRENQGYVFDEAKKIYVRKKGK